jgi:hypothetical protein
LAWLIPSFILPAWLLPGFLAALAHFFNDDREPGSQGSDGADGGPNRQEQGADDTDCQRDFDQVLPSSFLR